MDIEKRMHKKIFLFPNSNLHVKVTHAQYRHTHAQIMLVVNNKIGYKVVQIWLIRI